MRPITWSTVIKTLTHLKVKNTARFAFAITLAFGLGSFNISTAQSLKTMEENEVGLDAPVDSESSNRLLPAEEETRPIDAEEFRVQIKKKSTSGRVVLLDDPTENRPKPGKILLLKNGKENVVAVRVLKNYIGKFAAKTVLPFGPATEMNQEYRALKKIGDKLMDMIRKEEMKRAGETLTDEELANEVAPNDQELDRGIPKPKASPAPVTKSAKSSPKAPAKNPNMPEPLFSKDGEELSINDIEVLEEDDIDMDDLAVQETRNLEPLKHALSVQYAGIKNVDQHEAVTSYNGIGLRYSYNLSQRVLLKKSTPDMLSAEIGAFYYKIAAFRESTDELTLMPILITGRYGILLGENFHLYGYAGFMFNNITSSQNIDLSTTTVDQPRTALGIGLNVKLGPAWALRGDFGTDMFGVGAVLKF